MKVLSTSKLLVKNLTFFFLSLYCCASFAQLEFLSCDADQFINYQRICREPDACHLFDSSLIFSTSPSHWTNLLQNKCMQQKTKACYCLTYLGGKYLRGNDFVFADVAIHGRYCGWRSDHKGIDWSDKQAVRRADAISGQDSLDEICRVHDVDYDSPQIGICEADKKAISSIVSLVLDPNSGLPKSSREQGLAIAGSLYMNKETCHILDAIK